jgi:hypothetical protein
MRRQGRRRVSDYLETEELNETYEVFEETEADINSEATEEEA